MNLTDLTQSELINIEGGLDEDYNAGYAVGAWLRKAVDAFGDVVDAFSPFS
ncbi:hypothetical protein [Croceivirga radicis]|uniref:hypothetical protein n=1 Tax=Croceivirga radicis TaxID=1929488 RepID=UPI001595D418|nr:hypothetical protein [Croceivirga radicis]